jgi:alkanesulfonate monooxygenase
VAQPLTAAPTIYFGGASAEQVAERIAEYEAIGLDTFILSAYPNLEEAVRVGEDLLPLVRGRRPQHHKPELVAAS